MEGHDLLNERHFWLDTLHVKQVTYSTAGSHHPCWIETDTLNMLIFFLILPTTQKMKTENKPVDVLLDQNTSHLPIGALEITVVPGRSMGLMSLFLIWLLKLFFHIDL